MGKLVFKVIVLCLFSLKSVSSTEEFPFIRSLEISPETIDVILKSDSAPFFEEKLAEGCEKLIENDLIRFIEDDISPLFTTQPQFCGAFQKEVTKEDKVVSFMSPNPDEGQLRKRFSLLTNVVKVNSLQEGDSQGASGKSPEAIERNLFSKLLNDHVIQEFSVPLEISEQTEMDKTDVNLKSYVEASRNRLRADPVLKQTLLHRIWPSLSALQKMKLHRKCDGIYLNNNKVFWEFKEGKGDEALFDRALSICQADSTSDLIPYLDRSVLLEYGLYLHHANDAPYKLFSLCEAWPRADLSNRINLPKTTRTRVMSNYQDFASFNLNYDNGVAITLFNEGDGKPLNEEEKKAIRIYTGHSYNEINAYEQWGYLGLWVVNKDRQKNMLEARFKLNPIPKREDFENLVDYYKAYEAWVLKMRVGKLPDNWDTMSKEEKSRHISEKEISFHEDQEGRSVPQTARNLKSALEKLDHYQGVSFGSHQLNSHIFSSLKKGGSFSPGFFMSTSSDPIVAETFLKLPVEKTPESIAAVEGYFFVVKNESGTPIDNLSQYSGEYEVLVHPDAQFEVLDIEPFSDGETTYPNVKVVYIKEKK